MFGGILSEDDSGAMVALARRSPLELQLAPAPKTSDLMNPEKRTYKIPDEVRI